MPKYGSRRAGYFLYLRPVVQNRHAGAIPDVITLTADVASRVVSNADDHRSMPMLPAPLRYGILGTVILAGLLVLKPASFTEVLLVAVPVCQFRLYPQADMKQAGQGIFPAVTGGAGNGADYAVARASALGILVVEMEG